MLTLEEFQYTYHSKITHVPIMVKRPYMLSYAALTKIQAELTYDAIRSVPRSFLTKHIGMVYIYKFPDLNYVIRLYKKDNVNYVIEVQTLETNMSFEAGVKTISKAMTRLWM